jgi:hypothetical protein
MFHFWFSGLLERSQICNIILPNSHCLSLIYCYIAFIAFSTDDFNPVVFFLA